MLLNNLLYLLPILSLASAYRTFKNVLVADDSNFEDLIHEKGKYTFVNFYSQNCQFCNKLGPQYEPLAELFNNTKVQIAQIDGRKNNRIRKQENIHGFPTLRIYAYDGTHMGSFVGERTTEELANFVTSHTGVVPKWPELKVEEITTPKELNEIIQKEKGKSVVVAFLAPWVDDWNGRYSFYERLAGKESDMKFLRLDSTSEETSELASLYKIDSYPTVMKFNGSPTKNFRVLSQEGKDNKLTVETVTNFIKGDDETIGEIYKSLKELENSKLESQEEEFQYKRGFNSNGRAGEFSQEEEEENYRKLREL